MRNNTYKSHILVDNATNANIMVYVGNEEKTIWGNHQHEGTKRCAGNDPR